MATNEEELAKFRQQWRQEIQTQHHHEAEESSTGASSQQPKLTHHRHRRKSSAHSHSSDGAPPPLSPTTQKHQQQQQLTEDAGEGGEDGAESSSGRAADGQAKGFNELTALEAYEQAVALETDGNLNDALTYYRRAYRLDPRVDRQYKDKYFPKSAEHGHNVVPPAAAASAQSSLSSTAKASRTKTDADAKMPPPMPTNKPAVDPKMKGRDTDYYHQEDKNAGDGELPPTYVLIKSFVGLTILPEEQLPPNKKCWISMVPKEILLHIIRDVALVDIGSFVRLARVCKATCWLVYSESGIWKEVCNRTWKEMCWGPKWKCDILGNELDEDSSSSSEDEDNEVDHSSAGGGGGGGATVIQDADGYLWLGDSGVAALPDVAGLEISSDEKPDDEDKDAPPPAPPPTEPSNERELVKYGGSWKRMFVERPRIRYNGAYIATCTYMRAGHHTTNTLQITNSYHWVTYYRYLRFYPDGFVMSLLTTTEPSEVVYALSRENWMRVRYHNPERARGQKHVEAPALPAHSNVLRAVLPGRWKFSFDPEAEDHTPLDGRVEIETEGAGGTWKYIYQMELWLKMRPKGGAGKKYSGSRSDQLSWGKFYSFNRTSQDVAEFSLRNDKPFFFSRVKAYEREMGLYQ